MSKYELIGLVLNDGEKSRIKELCLKYGIPITFPTLFDDNINYHLWAFNKGGIGLAGTQVMRVLETVLYGPEEFENYLNPNGSERKNAQKRKTLDEWLNYRKNKDERIKYYKDKNLKFVIDEFAKENNLKVIMHFPHSSLEAPDSFWKDVNIDKEYFDRINLKMSDVLLLELFKDWEYKKIIAPYSRLYVDVEKYWDEEKEIMAKKGMGAVYTKDLFLNILHKKRQEFMKEAKIYYDEHHERLSAACDCQQDVLIIDVHSFGEEMARLVTNKKTLPDICLGVNDDNSRCDILLEQIKFWCKSNGVRYRINYPYKGSILPNKTNSKNKIYSLMLEINKRYYL